MNWLISIHSYLVRNSARRWLEQPLSVASKLIVGCLLGIFTTLVLAGIRSLGDELDKRLNDEDILTASLSESYNAIEAFDETVSEAARNQFWKAISPNITVVYRATLNADIANRQGLPIIAVDDIEGEGLVDDFYLFSNQLKEGQRIEFQVGPFSSEATVRKIPDKFEPILMSSPGLFASFDRISPLLSRGFSKNIILKADGLHELQRLHDIADTLRMIERRRIFVQSNLHILREIEKIRSLQSKALIAVTILSSLILGVVFGSLAWLEYREERFVLALIKSFGVKSFTLLIHSLIENCIIALAGVGGGIAFVQFASNTISKSGGALGLLMPQLNITSSDSLLLLMGSLFGGLLSVLPAAIGMRKQLGLVLT